MNESTASECVISEGPWRLNDGRKWETFILNHRGESIAKVCGASYEGDAHLLVAAREMFDSLREMVALYDGVRDMVGESVAAKLARADAALAKAEGK